MPITECRLLNADYGLASFGLGQSAIANRQFLSVFLGVLGVSWRLGGKSGPRILGRFAVEHRSEVSNYPIFNLSQVNFPAQQLFHGSYWLAFAGND